MNNKEYTQSLENIISKILTPLDNIPFKLVIKSLSEFEILDFNKKNKKHQSLLKNLIEVCETVKQNIKKKGGLSANRPNEIGNYIEPFLKEALNKQELIADTPKLSNGKKKSTGYPDFEFRDKEGNYYYLECKTFNIKNISTTQRSFYLSPSKDFKINRNAIHFLISFEVKKVGQNYMVENYKILTLENLRVNLKNEFNTHNKNLYSQENILYES